MCDMHANIAARVFGSLNPETVKVRIATDIGKVVSSVTDTEPKELVYPEGWYYAKGYFTNKHHSTTGAYQAVIMYKSNGDIWDAIYCTAD